MAITFKTLCSDQLSHWLHRLASYKIMNSYGLIHDHVNIQIVVARWAAVVSVWAESRAALQCRCSVLVGSKHAAICASLTRRWPTHSAP